MEKKNLPRRFFMYIMGVFIINLGIATAVKSDMGVTPIMAIPYAFTCIMGWEMGLMTRIFHFALVMFQLVLLRRRFQVKSFFQILVGIFFGYCTTFCNFLFSFLPEAGTLAARLALSVLSPALLALGIFFYLPANIMPVAPDGAMLAMRQVLKMKQGPCKVLFDCSNVAIGLAICLAVLHRPGSVGLGTVISAVLIGNFLSVYNRFFGPARDRLFRLTP